MQGENSAQPQDAARLLFSIAEQLKMSLTSISRQAELADLLGENTQQLRTIRVHSAAALNLVDGYLFGLNHLTNQVQLPLEPVSLSSVLSEVSPSLKAYGKAYNTDVVIAIEGKYAPVMAHRQGIVSALLSLGYSLITGSTSQQANPQKLTIALRKTNIGIAAGVFGNIEMLSGKDWQNILERQRYQPLRSMTNSGAGIFVADSLMRSMDATLQPASYRRQHGFSATFSPSQQLVLV